MDELAGLDWKELMGEAFRLAKEKRGKVQAYNKEKYDDKVKEETIAGVLSDDYLEKIGMTKEEMLERLNFLPI